MLKSPQELAPIWRRLEAAARRTAEARRESAKFYDQQADEAIKPMVRFSNETRAKAFRDEASEWERDAQRFEMEAKQLETA